MLTATATLLFAGMLNTASIFAQFSLADQAMNCSAASMCLLALETPYPAQNGSVIALPEGPTGTGATPKLSCGFFSSGSVRLQGPLNCMATFWALKRFSEPKVERSAGVGLM